jgi:hypothetical protein
VPKNHFKKRQFSKKRRQRATLENWPVEKNKPVEKKLGPKRKK